MGPRKGCGGVGTLTVIERAGVEFQGEGELRQGESPKIQGELPTGRGSIERVPVEVYELRLKTTKAQNGCDSGRNQSVKRI